MNRTFQWVLRSAFDLLLTTIPTLAHHTIGAEFDTRDTVALAGVFTKIEWNIIRTCKLPGRCLGDGDARR